MHATTVYEFWPFLHYRIVMAILSGTEQHATPIIIRGPIRYHFLNKPVAEIIMVFINLKFMGVYICKCLAALHWIF